MYTCFNLYHVYHKTLKNYFDPQETQFYECISICMYCTVCVCVSVVSREPLNIQHYFQNCAHLYTQEWLMKPTSY